MACESARRQSVYLKIGCNAYHKRDPTSQPMSFWTEQDVLAYLKMTGIPYASVYGEIVEENGRLTTTGAKRTGCMFCMFGVHLEKKPNRFQRMALTHPKAFCSDLYGTVEADGNQRAGVAPWVEKRRYTL